MKKLSLLFILSIAFLHTAKGQDQASVVQARNEIKTNAFNLIAFSFLDLQYEYLLNEEASLGISVLFNVGEDEDFFDEFRQFSFTPYYRQYFSNKYAKGFFVEGFGMLNSGDSDIFFFDDVANPPQDTSYTDFALGISVGGKFVTKRGFIAEIYTGIGRNLLDSDFAPEIVTRGGISLGYRF
ncbi:DUF3575 domain-containing protein [Spongiimicrobium salis]|uniref:DUF3575 domain-containing protein n=1 Tax=Spongiimicrobium salis TaxID=1667022 RepID=UPI00374DC144